MQEQPEGSREDDQSKVDKEQREQAGGDESALEKQEQLEEEHLKMAPLPKGPCDTKNTTGSKFLATAIVIRYRDSHSLPRQQVGSDVMQSGFGVKFLFWSGEF